LKPGTSWTNLRSATWAKTSQRKALHAINRWTTAQARPMLRSMPQRLRPTFQALAIVPRARNRFRRLLKEDNFVCRTARGRLATTKRRLIKPWRYNTSHNLICVINAEGVEFSAISKKSWLFAAFSVPKECDNE
jgi:hypothetical protein